MSKDSNVTKIISIVLVLLMVFSSLSISASAASYKTGTYTVTANSGINVRKGAGTGYSKVGAASKGITFNVSKISGSWGYTSSIKCTNGTKSGWVSLDYCSKKSSSTNNTSSSSASKYSTGSYTVNSNSGINVRKGAGTGYSKVGAAARGVTFNVTKVNGSWGYTSSIRCTNGTRSGWVSLDYCVKNATKNSNATPSKSTTVSTKQTNENGVVYTYITMSVDTSSMENWINSMKSNEKYVCNAKKGVIVEAKVTKTKTVTWKVSKAVVYSGPGITGTVNMKYNVPSEIKYKVHSHTRNMGFGSSWYYAGGCIVTVYTCNCGYRKELMAWEIPLPDLTSTSDVQTTKKVIQGLPQIN